MLQEAQKQLSYGRIIAFLCRAIVSCDEEEAEPQQALQELPEKMPIVNVKVFAAELKVSTQATNLALQRLAEAVVVRDRSGRDRRQIFAAEEVISILGRPFGANPKVVMEEARQALSIAGGGQYGTDLRS